MQSIEYSKENYPILNQKYNILATLCKVLVNMRIKGNEEADKAAKGAMDVAGVTQEDYSIQTLLPDHQEGSERQKKWENSNSKLHYIKPSIEECLQ